MHVCFGARHFCLCTVCVCVCVFCTEPVEYEAQDVSVRVMSPQSVLVSWVDPVLETGRVNSQVARWESEEACVSVAGRRALASAVFKQFPFFLTQIVHRQVQGERRVGTVGVQGEPPEEGADRHPDSR